MKNKKAQTGMGNTQMFVMSIIGIAVVLFVGLVIIGQLQTTTIDAITATSYSNESFTFANATATALSGTCVGDTISCSALYNNSANTVEIGSGNYTCSGSSITVTDNEGLNLPATLYVDYSCKNASTAYNAAGTIQTKLSTIPTWIGILITVALAFIVLGYFYGRRQ